MGATISSTNSTSSSDSLIAIFFFFVPSTFPPFLRFRRGRSRHRGLRSRRIVRSISINKHVGDGTSARRLGLTTISICRPIRCIGISSVLVSFAGRPTELLELLFQFNEELEVKLSHSTWQPNILLTVGVVIYVQTVIQAEEIE